MTAGTAPADSGTLMRATRPTTPVRAADSAPAKPRSVTIEVYAGDKKTESTFGGQAAAEPRR
jgi:hypothetical protein